MMRARPALRYIGLADETGYAVAAKALLRALSALDIDLLWEPMLPGSALGLGYAPAPAPDAGPAELHALRDDTRATDAVILHLVPEYFPFFLERERARGARLVIGHTIWETSRLPGHWPDLINQLDAVIVPTAWNRDVFRASGVTIPIIILPHLPQYGAAAPSPGAQARLAERLPDLSGRRVFYTIGTWLERKGITPLVTAFTHAFRQNDPVALIIKTTEFDLERAGPDGESLPVGPQWAALLARTMEQTVRIPAPIHLLTETLPAEEIRALHERADCFVSLARAEGWGLGAFEAASLGKPVITTGWGGPTAFLSARDAYCVDYTLQPVRAAAPNASYTSDQYWAEPDISAAVDAFRAVWDHPQEAHLRGARAAARIRETIDPAQVAQQLWREILRRLPGDKAPTTKRARPLLQQIRDRLSLVRGPRIGIIAPGPDRRRAQTLRATLAEVGFLSRIHATASPELDEDLVILIDPKTVPAALPASRCLFYLTDADAQTQLPALVPHLAGSLGILAGSIALTGRLLAAGCPVHKVYCVGDPSFGDAATPAPLWSEHHLVLRALLGLGVITEHGYDSATRDMTLPSSTLVLVLPEHAARFRHARAQRLGEAALFPGFRHAIGWQGCAASYRFMARRALRENRVPLTVYEDDAALPADIAPRLTTLRAQLAGYDDAWDLFAGLISDLSAEARIHHVADSGAERLVTLDAVTGLVFTIFNRRALECLARFEVRGSDVMRHTIDRFLERQDFRCITPLRPLVAHREDLVSTLWYRDEDGTGLAPVANSAMVDMIAASQARLQDKVRAFLAAEAAGQTPSMFGRIPWPAEKARSAPAARRAPGRGQSALTRQAPLPEDEDQGEWASP